jgi:hypothetical protein
MNEQKQPSPPSENDDVDLPPIASDPVRAGSTIVFSGDPAEVSAGFALALQLLGIDPPTAEPCPGDLTRRKQ